MFCQYPRATQIKKLTVIVIVGACERRKCGRVAHWVILPRRTILVGALGAASRRRLNAGGAALGERHRLRVRQATHLLHELLLLLRQDLLHAEQRWRRLVGREVHHGIGRGVRHCVRTTCHIIGLIISIQPIIILSYSIGNMSYLIVIFILTCLLSVWLSVKCFNLNISYKFQFQYFKLIFQLFSLLLEVFESWFIYNLSS